MSELQHPPIDTSSVRTTTLENDFAERTYEILAQYCHAHTAVFDDFEVTYPTTDRVDLISTNEDIEVAMRLVRHPTFVLTGQDVPAEKTTTVTMTPDYNGPNDEYIVIGLQYGTLEDSALDDGVYEDFDWQPYVLAVMHKSGDANVLDAKTGQDIPTSDIMYAGYLMEIMAKELRGMLCEDAIEGDDEIPIYPQSLTTVWEDLPTGEALDINYDCNICGQRNTPCGCPNSQMN